MQSLQTHVMSTLMALNKLLYYLKNTDVKI